MLDPFQPEKASDVKRLKAIQKAIFENFKSFVSERRGEKIKGKKIFNGEVWDATEQRSWSHRWYRNDGRYFGGKVRS